MMLLISFKRVGNVFISSLLFFSCTLQAYAQEKIKKPEDLTVTSLTCEYQVNPMGIDNPKPALSWIVQSHSRNKKQVAYHILVASSSEKLESSVGDLWDTGKIHSDQSTFVVYNGKTLNFRDECFWKVRIWGENNKITTWSKTAYWTMGPLANADWENAKWIGPTENDKVIQFPDAKWIWFAGGTPPEGIDNGRTYFFKRKLNIPANRRITKSSAHFAADDNFKLFVNKKEFASYELRINEALTGILQNGINDLSIHVSRGNKNPQTNPAGLIGCIKIEFEKGEPLVIYTDKHWYASDGPLVDESNKAWDSAKEIAANGKKPWGNLDNPERNSAAAPLLRKATQISKKPIKATATICGLGYYELYINGKKVSDHVLSPAFTDYNKRLSYFTYDINDYLIMGNNTVGVILGNGFYNTPTPDLFGFEKALWKKPPQLLLHIAIKFADGTQQTIISDNTWKWSTGPIVYNSVRGGETYDARLEKEGWHKSSFNDTDWAPVTVVSAPEEKFVAQKLPPIRVVESIKPIRLTEPKPGIYVFDLGRNLTGWARIKLMGIPGQKVTIHYNEMLKSDGTIDTVYSAGHTYGRFQRNEYLFKSNEEEVFEPRFTYHGFRYVQVTGLSYKPDIESLVGQSVHNDLQTSGQFECSNGRLNQLHQAVRRTLLDCIHGMPGEEPTREKMGWTQDGLNTMEAYMLNFDATTAYIKYLRDMIDAQEANGHVPPVIPTNGWGLNDPDGSHIYYDDPWWGGTLSYVAWKLYEFTGDSRILEEAYIPMKNYVDYLGSTAEDFIVSWSLGDWLDYGWANGPKLTPVNQTSTDAYFYLASQLSKSAAILNKKADEKTYRALSDKIKLAYDKKFFKADKGLYTEGSQTAQALPLFLGIVPENKIQQVKQNLLKDITSHRDHITAGFIGVMPTIHYLSANGHENLAYRIITQEDRPGWLHMVKGNNSTLGENLDSEGYGTQHHPFAACIGSWFYLSLGGIQPDPNNPGFKKIIIKPIIPADLSWVKSSYQSIYGAITSEWKKEKNKFILHVVIPANTTAEVYLPSKDISKVLESGKPVRSVEVIRSVKNENNFTILSIGSGEYTFQTSLN